MNLYERIKKIAKKQGKSISKLERELGFPRSSVSKFVTNTPSVDKVEMIADYLNVSIDFLVKGTPLEKKEARVNMKNELENILKSLDNNTGLYPSGKLPESDIEKEALANSIKIVMATIDSFDNK